MMDLTPNSPSLGTEFAPARGEAPEVRARPLRPADDRPAPRLFFTRGVPPDERAAVEAHLRAHPLPTGGTDGGGAAMNPLPEPDRQRIIAWLGSLKLGLSDEQYWATYHTWARNGVAWDRHLGTGGTYTMRALMWYQHVHRPGSTDSRPGVICRAILAHLDEAKAA